MGDKSKDYIDLDLLSGKTNYKQDTAKITPGPIELATLQSTAKAALNTAPLAVDMQLGQKETHTAGNFASSINFGNQGDMTAYAQMGLAAGQGIRANLIKRGAKLGPRITTTDPNTGKTKTTGSRWYGVTS